MESVPTSAALKGTDKKWDDMNGGTKLLFIAKLVLMICSAGFIYGNILTP